MHSSPRAGALALTLLISGAAGIAPAIGAPGATAQAPSPAPAGARVTYITGKSVYIDAGRDDGLLPGAEVQLLREGQVIATLRVEYLSAHRAACSIVAAQAEPIVGDTARYLPRQAPPGGGAEGGEAEGGAPPARRARGGLFGSGIRGRVGVRYLEVSDRSGNDGGFSQPAFDLRLDGNALGGGPIDLQVDVRSRRTYRTLPTGADETDSENRVYRMSAAWRIDERQQVVVGRQFAPAVAALSIFDGVLYSLDGDRTGFGAFTGVQPDAVDMAFNSDIQELGGYFQVRGAPSERRRWTLTTGMIGSYTEKTVNREFLYVQAQYFGPRLSAYMAQEVDYNRAWKVSEANESALSPTSTFANLRMRAGDRLTFYAGYDNRRNVRLYRDRVTPETEFDDSHRQGAWAGTSLRFGERWFASADVRSSDGGDAGSADGYSASLGVDRLTRANLGLRWRATHYGNDRSDGWLYSLGTGFDMGRHAHLELTGGRLEESNLVASAFDRSLTWYGIDLDILLGRTWYWLISAERNDGDEESSDQIYSALSYRF